MPPLVPNIWQLQTKGDVISLVEALRHPDAGTRRGAAASLRALGAWQAVPALQAALTIENDWQVHAAISAALQYLDHDIHIENMIKNRDARGLTKMLNSHRADEIITACRALGEIGDLLAVEPLIMVFKNNLLPPKVRLESAEALLRLKNPPAVVSLLGALRREDWQVRRNAAAVLGQLGVSWAVEPLAKALDDVEPLVRRTAAAALRRIGTPEALSAVGLYERALKPEEIEAESAELPVVAAPAVRQEPSQKTEALRRQLTGIISGLRAQFAADTSSAPPIAVEGEPPKRKGDTGRLPNLPADEPFSKPVPVPRQLTLSKRPGTGMLPSLPPDLPVPLTEPPNPPSSGSGKTKPLSIADILADSSPSPTPVPELVEQTKPKKTKEMAERLFGESNKPGEDAPSPVER